MARWTSVHCLLCTLISTAQQLLHISANKVRHFSSFNAATTIGSNATTAGFGPGKRCAILGGDFNSILSDASLAPLLKFTRPTWLDLGVKAPAYTLIPQKYDPGLRLIDHILYTMGGATASISDGQLYVSSVTSGAILELPINRRVS